MISIGTLLVMLIYVAGVMSTQMFSSTSPERFGDLPTSLLSMFQVMTGDDWAVVIKPVTDQHPAAWAFFIAYILISTYIVLNLFIAVAVEALEMQQEEHDEELVHEVEDAESAVLEAIESLRSEVAALRDEVSERG
jgi:voltage-gated sodium channel